MSIEEPLASVDGEIMPTAEATVSITDPGFFRGDGIFEVVRVYDGKPFALDEHMARLERSGRGIRLDVDAEAVRADLYRLLAQAGTGPSHDLVRILLTRAGRRILTTEPLHEAPETARVKTITYAPSRVLNGIKSFSYGANMLASRLAKEEGYDEALLVTPHGRVLEAPTSSIFWVANGELYTPPLAEGILASITRAIVLEVVGGSERVTTLDDLLGADEVFLASTTREVQPVVAIDEAEFVAPGPVSVRIADAVQAHINGVLAAA